MVIKLLLYVARSFCLWGRTEITLNQIVGVLQVSTWMIPLNYVNIEWVSIHWPPEKAVEEPLVTSLRTLLEMQKHSLIIKAGCGNWEGGEAECNICNTIHRSSASERWGKKLQSLLSRSEPMEAYQGGLKCPWWEQRNTDEQQVAWNKITTKNWVWSPDWGSKFSP